MEALAGLIMTSHISTIRASRHNATTSVTPEAYFRLYRSNCACKSESRNRAPARFCLAVASFEICISSLPARDKLDLYTSSFRAADAIQVELRHCHHR